MTAGEGAVARFLLPVQLLDTSLKRQDRIGSAFQRSSRAAGGAVGIADRSAGRKDVHPERAADGIESRQRIHS